MKPGMLFFVLLSSLAFAQSATQIDRQHLVEPADLARQLSTSQPLVLSVGPHTLYAQAHVTGSEYVGMASTPEGLQKLRTRVKDLPKSRYIVLYCGCCPWDRCPNVQPAFEQLQRLGFKNVKVLRIPQNFGVDWVDKGLPTQKGDPMGTM
jgi:thiosulfate/3-mercaptopyruvate sulfurtransferase